MSPRQLFDGTMHYEIPAFQRPYVWNEEDQWAPLWADVIRVAESHVVADGGEPEVPHHFLGAVVYESKPPVVGDVTRHKVIDGQQRTTTLQLMIDAVQSVVAERGHVLLAEDLENLILNRSSAFRGKPERFKLWPSKQDRAAFAQAMDPAPDWSGEHRILEAHRFFGDEARTWLSGTPDPDGNEPPGTEEQRATALAATLRDRLLLVAINLTRHDESQVIFETLNDRGTPLLKADLIKNWVFQKGDAIGADVEAWTETHWVDFDDDWWRAEITQGRHQRSRIDIFMQYWLTMRLSNEVKTEQVFRAFKNYAGPHMVDPRSADGFLREFRRDADTYRALADLPEDTAQGSFYSRVIETMGLAATSPLLLWLLSDNHKVPEDQIETALSALESWVLRRTLLRMTMKDVNRLMVTILKLLDRGEAATAGDTVRAFLTAQTTDTRLWPSDEQMKSDLPRLRLYGYLGQPRLRVVLEAIERKLRTDFHEDVPLPSRLEIEHVMPQAWRTYWNPEPPLTPEQAAERDHRLQTLGNLTLVTRSLNGALSHRPWTDAQAAGMRSGGEAGLGKRGLLAKYSLLALSKDLVNGHPDAWTDDDIDARGAEMTAILCEVWPGPPSGGAPAEVIEETGEPNQAGELPRVEWTVEQLAEFEASTTDLTRGFLDYVAKNLPGELFVGDDLENSGYVSGQVSGITGAMARRTYQEFQRINPPVEFVNTNGRWHYRMDPAVAKFWLSVRS
ncbi:DUF262 domain-containing protein [Actinomadura spongiicola]|uniref:DUF262 domain-containing protein n=1 Tax=Actinomadura spongiicola TaxID=2303421 RepID=UPI0011C1AB6E|nr:DUF262 domain-containing protein [Actinomadura spongiicola]